MVSDCCRICGFDDGEPPWGYDGISPTFNICSCCGAEHGYEDCSIESARRYRLSWQMRGYPWFNKKAMPLNWDKEKQLTNIPKEYL